MPGSYQTRNESNRLLGVVRILVLFAEACASLLEFNNSIGISLT